MSRFLKHTLRCVVFLAVLALLLTGVSQLVRPKNNTRSDGIHDPAANGILGEPDNTIDLLILGDSESYSAFIPMQLWQQYGYTAYCCGTSRQTLYYSEAFLHKAFQKQSPKLVILETDVIFIDFSYGSMLLQEAGDLFPVFSYHDRWKSLKANDWRMTVNYTHTENAKGYQLRCNATPADASNYMTPSDAYAPIPKRNRAYVERIKAFCDENGAQLMLVSTPSTVNWNMARHNSTQALADKLQIPFIDFNTMSDQVSINWSTDTRDQGDHLNYFGAKKVTAVLGDYLSDNSRCQATRTIRSIPIGTHRPMRLTRRSLPNSQNHNCSTAFPCAGAGQASPAPAFAFQNQIAGAHRKPHRVSGRKRRAAVPLSQSAPQRVSPFSVGVEDAGNISAGL